MNQNNHCHKSIYDSARSRMPLSLKTLISQVAFRLRRRPIYRLNKGMRDGQRFEKGAVVFSADFELAWAWRYDRDPHHRMSDLCNAERENIPVILAKLEILGIPLTWAIVGHLFLEQCEKHNNKAHGDMPRPNHFRNRLWIFHSGDWYDHDPCSNLACAGDWYAPDLIKHIINSKINHEIACHSFSHVGFNENYCSVELARAELKKCAQVMAAFGLKPVTMVFPGDEAGHFALLSEFGYRCVRYFPNANIEISIPIKTTQGLWAIPVASNVVPDDEWDSSYILWRLKKYVDKAIEKKALCHFWFHPSISRDRMNRVLFPVLDYCAQKRKEGTLEILTMTGIIDAMEKRCAE